MAGLLWRALFAVIALVILYALIPPLLRIIGFSPSTDVLAVVRVCIAGLALLYVVRGWTVPPPP